MARPICIWLPSLAVLALNACGGSTDGFFSDGGSTGSAGSSHAGASSHAGSSSSAGSPSAAGGASSAGNTSSAGNPASAGQDEAGDGSGGAQTAGASSGRAGANSGGGTGGSHAGAGGSHAGAGGSGAAAGHAGTHSGSAGSGGTSQDPSCSDLLKQATQQLDDARTCNLAANATQCTGTVTSQCGCEVSVQRNDSPETKAYLATLKQLKDKDCVTACPAVACKMINDGQCKSSGSGSMGQCAAVSYGPTP